MNEPMAVITGLGVIAPNAIGAENFWQALEQGKDASGEITCFDTEKFSLKKAAEIKNFDPKEHLGPKGLRNIDRGTLFLLAASKMAIEGAGLAISEDNTDEIGVTTGTTFSHFWSILEFDREVFKDGLEFSNPALFPSTVINAASSQVSIRFNIQGFNTTISTGYTSGLQALKYTLDGLSSNKAKTVLSTGVDALTFSLFFGFYKLKYMAGFTGIPVSCPFDNRHNGPVIGEAAGALCVESEKEAKSGQKKPLARIRGVSCYFDAFKIGRIHPQGEGLERSIIEALDKAGVSPQDIDYVSSCANSSPDMDRIEVKVLKKVFGSSINKTPVSSIKSMIGETFSASSVLQIISCIGAMDRGLIPPTINFRQADPDCDIDCVANKAQKKDVKLALVTSFGPGGYNSACVLEKYKG